MKVDSSLVKYALSFLIAALILCTGFFREFVFVNVNEQLVYLWFEHETTAMAPSLLSIFGNFSYWELYYTKWVLTGLFTVLFWLESLLAVKVLFEQWRWRELSIIYALLIAASVCIFSAWKLADQTEDGYLIARFLMGLAQSPVPLMLVIPALYLRAKMGRSQD